jgi:CheY-like chemotaxis protein
VASHKILVIDDSRVIRMKVQDMLPKGNFEVLEAKDGIEGLQLLREQRPNLIMLDFMMPKMGGYEVFQQIQTDPSLLAIPLVIMSGRKEEVTDKLAEPFEYFEFIEKPFEQEQLMGAIKSAMMKARKRPASVAQPARAAAPAAAASGVDAAAIAALQTKVTTLEAEVVALKKQLTQVVNFVKQKLS